MSLWKKLRAVLGMHIANMAAYRAEIIIWILTGSIPLIMLAVWIGKAEAVGGSLNGFSAQDFTAYFLSAWFSQQMIVAWVSWELDFHIRQGTLSPKLLRPFSIYWDFIGMHLGERFVRVPIGLAVVIIGTLLIPGTVITPNLSSALIYLLSITMAWLIRFQISFIVGTLSFWFDRSTAFDELYFLIAAFLTGSFAPLDFYPTWARQVIEWTPFPYLIYYPVQILNGNASTAAIIQVLLIQAAWLAVLTAIRVLLWQRGLKRFGAVGA